MEAAAIVAIEGHRAEPGPVILWRCHRRASWGFDPGEVVDEVPVRRLIEAKGRLSQDRLRGILDTRKERTRTRGRGPTTIFTHLHPEGRLQSRVNKRAG